MTTKKLTIITLLVLGCIFLCAVLLSWLIWGSDKPSFDEQVGCDLIDEDRGPLIVKSGSTIRLAAGKEYSYSSILIHKGGVLEFVSTTIDSFTVLKSRGNFRLEGTIRSRGFKLKGSGDCLEFKYKDRVGLEELYHDYGNIQNGGKGGAGGRDNECNPGSKFKLSCVAGVKGLEKCGGKGGDGMSFGQIQACRANNNGNNCYLDLEEGDNAGKDCDKCGDEKKKEYEKRYSRKNQVNLSPGGGGKGGGYGKFGGLLYIVSCKNFIGENGYIDVSGGQGEKGHDGASKRYTGGGGGGGGPGANGGKVYFNVKGNLSLPKINTDGGPGGPGGEGGKPHPSDGLSGYVGSKGDQGQSGLLGAIEILNSHESKQVVAKP